MKLIKIGYLGNYVVYVDLSKEEAMKRYDSENPDYTIAESGYEVAEINVQYGKFFAYDVNED